MINTGGRRFYRNQAQFDLIVPKARFQHDAAIKRFELSFHPTEDGVLVLQSSTPEAWARGCDPVVRDLAPGRPFHPETWVHLLAERGCRKEALTFGGEDSRLARIESPGSEAAAVNAAIDVVNSMLLGPAEYVLVAVRER